MKKRKGPEAIFGSSLRPNSCKRLRGRDLNPRPLGYEPNELPDCSTPRQFNINVVSLRENVKALRDWIRS